MRSLNLQAVRTVKLLYIILASVFISLFVLSHLRYSIVNNDVFQSVTSVLPSSSDRGESFAEPVQPVELVVASLSQQNTTWYSTFFPDWKSNIYVVDDRFVSLRVPRNKGHEAMVYLTFIIDRYDTLPDSVLFLHAERFQWHNDNPDYDGLPLLQNFQFDYLQQEGYVNLRCVWTLGCPAAIHAYYEDKSKSEQDKEDDELTGEVYRQAFRELLPELPVPTKVGVSCCAQFAVTRDTIRKRPRNDYIRFREWLIKTPLQDEQSGRFFEYSWHIIFGKSPVYCPSAQECYCKLYGMCDLQNCTVRGCKGRYELPPYSTLPEGWPRIGWDGEDRHYTGPS